MGTVSKNRGMSCVGVRKTGTTLIRVSTVMGTLYIAISLAQEGEFVERIARILGETEKTIKEWLAETH